MLRSYVIRDAAVYWSCKRCWLRYIGVVRDVGCGILELLEMLRLQGVSKLLDLKVLEILG
jgi:hypothetical protein